jgi:hypothetical protein
MTPGHVPSVKSKHDEAVTKIFALTAFIGVLSLNREWVLARCVSLGHYNNHRLIHINVTQLPLSSNTGFSESD